MAKDQLRTIYEGMLKEGETETKNEKVNQDSFIVARNENGQPKEQWVQKNLAKFKQNYQYTGDGDDITDTFSKKTFKPVAATRKAIIWTKNLQPPKSDNVISQQDFLEFCKAQKQINVQKSGDVFVRKPTQEEIAKGLETVVMENPKPIIFNFEAPWGGSMPVKENDVIIVMPDEVYRIASKEFNLTYKVD